MEIVRREMTNTCEGLPVTFVAKEELSDDQMEKLKEFVQDWPRAKGKQENLPVNYHPRLTFSKRDGPCAARFSADWFPMEWYESLAHRLEEDLPFLQRLELGEDFVPPFRDDEAFIHVRAKTVEFEDGSKEDVAPFVIAKYPVSIGQYDAFAKTTGYRTQAEQRGDEFSFRQHPALEGIPQAKLMPLPADWVCYHDAVAYCQWTGVRLPTEAEWIAAAIVDDELVENLEELITRQMKLRSRPEALAELHQEITGSVLDSGYVVIRCGPYLVRGADVSRNSHMRMLVKPNRYECMQFRVCK